MCQPLGGLVLVLNVREGIQQPFLAAIPVLLPLFFNSVLVEIEEIATDKLVRVKGSKVPVLLRRTQPTGRDGRHLSVESLG